jgi:hypothetical protein
MSVKFNSDQTIPMKIEYDDGKYKISRYEDTENNVSPVILTENEVEIKGIFFRGEGIQIININSMKLLFVFNLENWEITRVIDLEYRTVFITHTPFGQWNNIYPNDTGEYIVCFVKSSESKVDDKLSKYSMGIFILNTTDLIKKIKEEREKINLSELLANEKIVQNDEIKIVTLDIDDKKNSITNTIHTKPINAKTIIPKVVGYANIIRMTTRSSKINMKADDVVDNVISEEEWISETEFQIRHYLSYNPRLKKSEIQLTNRNFIDMIQRKEPLGKVLYKSITLQCDYDSVDSMTEIREETWKDWMEQKQRVLGNQHYISVVKERFTPYKSLLEILKRKAKNSKGNEYLALMEPVLNEDGTRYSDEVTETVANFEVCFPNFYPYSILFFTLKDDKITIQKIVKETGVISYSKKYSVFRVALKELEKLI